MTNLSKLSVFYTLEMPDVRWTYTRLPKSWKWTGSVHTEKLKNLKYRHKEHFEGAPEHLKPAREYLEYVFKQLKVKQVVKCYKINKTLN